VERVDRFAGDPLPRGQIGHADAAFTLPVYAKTMDRRDGEPERLRAL
jgi:hypothetical protein